MAENQKISDLTQGTPLNTDVIPYVDGVAGETKKALKSELKGDTGDTGPAGDAATIAVGTTTTLDAGLDATVANSGSSSAATFDFGIPKGEKGDDGDMSVSTYDPSGISEQLVGQTASQILTNKTLLSPTGIVKGDVGLGNVDNTSDATKNSATATLTNKTLTTPAISNPTGLDSNDVGLGNVDNTSDANQTSVGTLTVGNATAIVSAASKTAAGKVEIATTAEIDTGTDSTRAMPVDQFKASKRNIRWLAFNLVEAETACATDTNIYGDFASPIAGTILQSDTTPFYLYATNSTAGTTGTMVVDISKNGTSIMTTNKLDFDTTEKTTTTASTPPDLTTTTIAVGDIIRIDIDSIHTTAAKGLTVYMAIRE